MNATNKVGRLRLLIDGMLMAAQTEKDATRHAIIWQNIERLDKRLREEQEKAKGASK